MFVKKNAFSGCVNGCKCMFLRLEIWLKNGEARIGPLFVWCQSELALLLISRKCFFARLLLCQLWEVWTMAFVLLKRVPWLVKSWQSTWPHHHTHCPDTRRLMLHQWFISLVKKWQIIPCNWCEFLIFSPTFLFKFLCQIPRHITAWTNGSSHTLIPANGNTLTCLARIVMLLMIKFWRTVSMLARDCVPSSRNQRSLHLLLKWSPWA